MTSTVTPPVTVDHRPTPTRRVGYAMAIAVNGLMLWLANQLLDWQWPSFLTTDFDVVLPLLSASFVVGMAVNAGYLVVDRGRFRAVGELLTAGFGLAVSLQMWDVFPFDFTGWSTDWSWLVRVALVVGIVGSGIAILVHLVRLVRPTDD